MTQWWRNEMNQSEPKLNTKDYPKKGKKGTKTLNGESMKIKFKKEIHTTYKLIQISNRLYSI